jgi:hypothetical protein
MCRDCPGCATAITVTTDRRLYVEPSINIFGDVIQIATGFIISTIQKYKAEIGYSNMVQKRVNKVRKTNGWGV